MGFGCASERGQPAGLTSPTSIHQEVVIKAPAHRVYEVLTDAKEFQEMTGSPVKELSREPGGAFSLFGGVISGRQIELVPDVRVVQAWHEDAWGRGRYSLTRFELKSEGPAGTRIVLDHTGFPDGAGPHLAIGWKEHYWDPMARYLEK